MNTFTIALNNLRFYSRHGVLEHEKEYGNEFIVNLSVVIPFREELAADSLENTASYADLFEIVRDEMNISRRLLETVALSIKTRLLNRFPMIVKGFISIEKVHPPIQGMIGSASVTLNF